MAKQIKLHHIVPYLPYGLKIANVSLKGDVRSIYPLEAKINNDSIMDALYGVNQMPILRPLSDLKKEIEHNGEKIMFVEKYTSDIQEELRACLYDKTYFELLPYFVITRLFKCHFDVFGLIEKGLAIDINTLNN